MKKFMITVLIIAFFTLVAYWLKGNVPTNQTNPDAIQETKSNAEMQEPETLKQTTTAEGTIETVGESVKEDLANMVQVETNRNGSVWWISDDDYNIAIDESPQAIFHAKSDNPIHSEISSVVNQPANVALANKVMEELEKLGFTKDDKNSSKDYNDDQFVDYVLAYKKENTVCTLSFIPDSFTPDSIFNLTSDLECSDEFKKNYDEQSPFLAGLELKDNQVVIRIASEQDSFYHVLVNARRAGYYMIVKKENNTFTKIHAGQDIIPCETAEKYSVPEEIYQTCH